MQTPKLPMDNGTPTMPHCRFCQKIINNGEAYVIVSVKVSQSRKVEAPMHYDCVYRKTFNPDPRATNEEHLIMNINLIPEN